MHVAMGTAFVHRKITYLGRFLYLREPSTSSARRGERLWGEDGSNAIDSFALRAQCNDDSYPRAKGFRKLQNHLPHAV